MKTIQPTEAIQIISQSAWTILVIDSQGNIKECISFQDSPPMEWAHENRERLSGCAVRELPKQQLSPDELKEIIIDAAKNIEMFRRYEQGS